MTALRVLTIQVCMKSWRELQCPNIIKLKALQVKCIVILPAINGEYMYILINRMYLIERNRLNYNVLNTVFQRPQAMGYTNWGHSPNLVKTYMDMLGMFGNTRYVNQLFISGDTGKVRLLTNNTVFFVPVHHTVTSNSIVRGMLV